MMGRPTRGGERRHRGQLPPAYDIELALIQCLALRRGHEYVLTQELQGLTPDGIKGMLKKCRAIKGLW